MQKASAFSKGFLKRIWQLPTLPHDSAVPSAMRGLTSLFGMGRGEHPRQNHHKIFWYKCGTEHLSSQRLGCGRCYDGNMALDVAGCPLYRGPSYLSGTRTIIYILGSCKTYAPSRLAPRYCVKKR